jgi:hypothetical protein
MATKTTKEAPAEEKQSLPVNHPQAGYVSPDLSFREGVGALPEDEQAWHDERDAVQEEQAEKVADEEDKAAKEIRKNTEEYDKKVQAAYEKQIEKKVERGEIPEPVAPPEAKKS